MTLLVSAERKAVWARVLVGLFMSASLLAGVAGSADAAPMKLCKRNAENFSVYKQVPLGQEDRGPRGAGEPSRRG